MSESHEYYKKYLHTKKVREHWERIDSKYVDDYRQAERLAELEWREKDREEKEDIERGKKLLDWAD